MSELRLAAFGLMLSSATLLAQERELPELDCLLEPHELVNLGSPVPGILETISVQRGQPVRRGQVVASLMSGAEQAAVELAKARSEFGKRKVVRNEELYRDELISIHEKDEMATESLMSELELKEAEERLGLRTIRSPINGVVVERALSPGEYVQDTHVLAIAQLHPLNVELIVPVAYFGLIKQGMLAEVRPEAPVGGTYTAKVKIVDKVVDAASGTFGVRLELPNRDHSVPAGLRCTARFSDD